MCKGQFILALPVVVILGSFAFAVVNPDFKGSIETKVSPLEGFEIKLSR